MWCVTSPQGVLLKVGTNSCEWASYLGKKPLLFRTRALGRVAAKYCRKLGIKSVHVEKWQNVEVRMAQ